MKKILIVLLLLMMMLININNAHASTTSDYENLLNVANLNYNESTDTIAAKEYIPLKANKIYTFVATWEFFGEATVSRKSALINKVLGTVFKDAEGKAINTTVKLAYSQVGLYSAQFTTTSNCELLFTDLLVRGKNMDELLTDQFIFFEGSRYDFKGFKKEADFTGYTPVDGEVTIYTDYDSPITYEDIASNLKIYDANDGYFNLEDVTVVDNYSDNLSVGAHDIIFTATDKGQNSESLKVIVNVLDIKAPIIDGNAEIIWNMSNECPTVEDLRSNFTVSDNADSTITNEDIYISSSTLDSYEVNVKNQYVVTLAVKDASNNIGYFSTVIQAIDNEAPTILLKNLEIKLSEVGGYLFNDLYQQVIESVTDNSGKYSLGFKYNELYGYGGFSGVFEVTITATDPSGNNSSETATVTIIDDVAPEFYFKAEALETSVDKPYTAETLKQEIRRRLDARGVLYDDVALISSNYFNSENVEGVYTVKYAYSYNGEANYEIADINVTQASFNYAWLCLLLIPVGAVSGWLFFKKKKKCLD